MKEELQKCIFHTDKENEIWIENWDGEMERWKRRRDRVLEQIKALNLKIAFPQKELNKALNNLNRILRNRPRYYECRNERVREFWRFIRNYKDVEFDQAWGNENGKWGITQGGIYNFSLFVFPKFERINIERKGINNLIVQEDSSFWREGEIYGFIQDANFRKAIFTQDADFKEATFTQYADFREVTFLQHGMFENKHQ